MSLTRPAAAVIAVLFARWLATGHLTATVAGATISVPALAVAAACVLAVTGAIAGLLIYRVRAEREMLAAWQARRVAAR